MYLICTKVAVKLAACRSRFTVATPPTASSFSGPGATAAARNASARSGCRDPWVANIYAGVWISSRGKPPQDRVRGWEASGEIGVVLADIPEISDAVERFFEDATSRGLSEATIGNQDSPTNGFRMRTPRSS